MKAKETTYKGYRFRSRLEARWAVFFDALGLQWEYEPEGYVLSNGKTYLPDFVVREKGAFPDICVEVKPPKPMTIGERDKIWSFAHEISEDNKNVGVLVVKSDPLEGQAFLFGSFNGNKKSGPLPDFADFFCKWSGKDCETVEAAAMAARAARFEHNQVGSPDQWKRG